MTLLVVAPGPTWSTADVEAGLVYGLRAQGVRVIQFALGPRVDWSRRFLQFVWRGRRQRDPAFTLAKPTDRDAVYDAAAPLLLLALRHQVDAVLLVSALMIPRELLVLVRRAGLRAYVLLTESPYERELEHAIAGLVDGVWTMERTEVASLRRVCPHVAYLRHAWHPLRHQPGPQPGDDAVPVHDVVFVGTAFQERIEFLRAIDWRGIDLGLYGHWRLASRDRLRASVRGWETSNATTSALYRRARIGLNLYRRSRGWGRSAPRLVAGACESLSPRAYELAACGAFHLSDARAEVAETFGDLVPTFETPAEASALLRAWLVDAPGRAAVAVQLPAMVAGASWVDRAGELVADLTEWTGTGPVRATAQGA